MPNLTMYSSTQALRLGAAGEVGREGVQPDPVPVRGGRSIQAATPSSEPTRERYLQELASRDLNSVVTSQKTM